MPVIGDGTGQSLPVKTAAQIPDWAAAYVPVGIPADASVGKTFSVSLAELAKTGVLPVATKAALATATPRDGQLVWLLGYTTFGDGGGQPLRYDAASVATVDNGFVFDGPGSVGRYIALDQTVINLRQWGAIGGNTLADTDAFLRAIVELKRPGSLAGVIELPAGRYYIDETLDFGTARAWTLRGAGANTIQTVESSSYPDSGSNICWLGADGGTLMKAAGAGFRISGVAFFGSTVPQAGQGHHPENRAGIGFNLYFSAGIGSGDTIFDQTTWCDFDIAIQAGVANGDGNCADMFFNRTQFSVCDLGLKVVHDQGVNYHFSNVQIYGHNGSEVFARFERGGAFQADYVHMTGIDTLLSLGPNCGGNYDFGSVRVDGGFTKTPQIVFMDEECDDNRGGIHISFQKIGLSIAEQFADGRPMFTIRGSANLEVRNMAEFDPSCTLFHFGGSTTPFAGYPRVLIENCDFNFTSGGDWDDDPTWITGTKAEANWRARECSIAGIHSEYLPEIGRRKTITDADGTQPDARGKDVLICNHSSPITLSYFTGKEDNDTLTVFLSTNTSLANNLNLLHLNGGAGIAAPGFGGVVTFRRQGAAWWETSRSIL